jgi:hypothetical protein
LAAALRALGTGTQPSFWPDLPKVKQPVLIVTGDLDLTYTRTGGEMARLIPGARHVVVPALGHTVHLEGPRAWLDVVRPFLRDEAEELAAAEAARAAAARLAEQDADLDEDLDADLAPDQADAADALVDDL